MNRMKMTDERVPSLVELNRRPYCEVECRGTWTENSRANKNKSIGKRDWD